MKKLSYTLLFLLLNTFLMAQQGQDHFSRVKINLLETDLAEIARLGLEADHGELAKDRHLINDYSEREIAILKANHIDFEILIKDVKAHYRNQNTCGHDHPHDELLNRNPTPCNDNTDPDNPYDYETPVNYTYGSMGGYYTYEEMLAILDDMHAQYPHLITAKAPIGDIRTHDGHPIYWLRLSDNPTEDEVEPELLYTSLHHAREPNSLSQNIMYLWYLLENYETNPEIKYLVDHTEMYFIPCVNPDGYIHNQMTDPEGGGLWRKNRWADSTGMVHGVDLNRNYGYEWAADDEGSSPNVESAVYRGTAAFSEPETQAVRDFCNAHQFQICLNYHTYGNLLIYPWGYSDLPTEEGEIFSAFGTLMTSENNYTVGTGTETVGYTVNGNSDDWMYGEQMTKPRIFSMTPEVGNIGGFWPAQTQIDLFNKSSLRQNLVSAHLVLNYGEIEDDTPSVLLAETGALNLKFKKYGLANGSITINVAALSPNLTILSETTTTNLAHLEEIPLEVMYQTNATMPTELVFEATLDNGLYTWTQTFTKQYKPGTFETVLSDDGSSEELWQISNGWGLTDAEFVSPSTSWTDSPGDDVDYAPNSERILGMQDPINLTNASSALLRFYAKWDIEANYDYVQFMVSTDGQNFEAQCGNYTRIGNENQDENQPLYDGQQNDWVQEEIDLSAYLGETVYFQFRLVSDNFVERDGFYFDDLVVEAIQDGTPTESVATIEQIKLKPNPFTDQIQIDFILLETVDVLDIVVTDALGRTVQMQQLTNVSANRHQWQFNTTTWEAGLYFVQFKTRDGVLATRKLVK